jgi:hypothetical protein
VAVNSASPSTVVATSSVAATAAATTTPYMHPKKKMAHMDYLINNDRLVDDGGSGSRPCLVERSGTADPATFSRLPAATTSVMPVIDSTTSNAHTSRDKEIATAKDLSESSSVHTPVRTSRESGGQDRVGMTRRVRERNGPGGSGAGGSARKGGGDQRTKCDVCLGEGTNANLVR